MRELNRLGVTGVIDAGGGFQNYPEDYQVIEALHQKGEMTIRVAYNLFTQKPGGELDDFRRWVGMTRPGNGSDFLRLNGAGEMLTFSAADFEDFLEPRPDLPPTLEGDLPGVIRLLAENRWPFRLHATYDESIPRFLDIFEAVNREVPFDGLHWFFDHAETVTDPQPGTDQGAGRRHRRAAPDGLPGRVFRRPLRGRSAAATPPVARCCGWAFRWAAGTDATRVASYNPWVCLYWLVTGQTVGGTAPLPGGQPPQPGGGAAAVHAGGRLVLQRGRGAGPIKAGQLADLVVLSDDYFAVTDERIKGIESVLTVVGGKVVYAAGPFASLRRRRCRSARTGRRSVSTAGITGPGRHRRRTDSPPGGTPDGTPCCTACSGRAGAGRSPCGGPGARLGVLNATKCHLTGGTMHRIILFAVALGAAVVCGLAPAGDTKVPADKVLQGTNGVKLVVRLQGPYDADVPLQVVCYFKHKKGGDKTLGAAVELDRRLGGVIASLRNRGEFVGDEQETLLLTPPRGTIKPKLLLLVGLGDEGSLSPDTMERVGRTALRQAAKLGVERVTFAPLLRDQGNDKLAIGDVATAVIRGCCWPTTPTRGSRRKGWRRRPRWRSGWSRPA